MFGNRAVLRLRSATYSDGTGYLSIDKQRIATCHKRDARVVCLKSMSEDLHSAADAGSGQSPPPYNCFLNSVGDMPAFCLKNRAKWLG